jgi:hypothetical protein
VVKKKSQLATRKQRQIFKLLAPYIIGSVIISAAILYVWIYSEVDRTLKDVEFLHTSAIELGDDINILKDDIEYLTRVDVLTSRAKTDLGMVFTAPETIEIYIDEESLRQN